MSTYSDFLTVVRPEVSGAPKATMLQAIKSALRELCEKSQVWSYTMDPVTVFTDQPEIDLEFPSGSELASVVSVTVNDLPIFPGSGFDISVDSKTITLVSTPTQDETAVIKMVLRPSFAATSIKSWLVNDFLELVGHGALAVLQAQEGREWFNAQGAMYHMRKFDGGVSAAKIRAIKGGKVNSRLCVRPRPFI